MTPRAYALLTWTEAKLVARDTAGLVLPLVLPALILVMNGLGSDGSTERIRGVPVLDAYVLPLTIVMVVALIGVVNVPSFLASYRKTGVLRRLSVTPANPFSILAAQAVVGIAQTFVGVAAALLVARFAFDASMPRSPLTAAAAFALVIAAMFALGLLVAALAPTTNAAIAMGLLAFFALMATGGGFGSRENLPDWLATVGGHLPYGAGLDVLSNAWTGQTPDTSALVALAITVLASAAVATKTFRWT